MKRTSLLAIALLIPLFMAAQPAGIDKLFKKYGEKEGFTTVTVNRSAFEMLADIEPDDEDLQALSKIEYLKVLAVEDDDVAKDLNFYEIVMDGLNPTDYEELVTVKSEGTDVKVLVKEKEKGILEELLVVVGGDDNALVYIKGEIKLSELSGLSGSMPFEGLEALDALEEIEEEDI